MKDASIKPDRGIQAIEGNRSESQLKRIPVFTEQIQVPGTCSWKRLWVYGIR